MYVILQGCSRNKPYAAMVVVQSVFAGMVLLSKTAIAGGMNPYVFAAYRQALAAFALAPFALYMDRNQMSPPLSRAVLCKILAASAMVALTLNLFCLALNYVSATFAAALANTVPAVTFTLAIAFRMETVSLQHWHGMVKTISSVLSLTGALICTFARGPKIYPESHSHSVLHTAKENYTNGAWIKGSLIILAANVAWGLWLIMQGHLTEQYPAKLRLTALQCLFSCAMSVIWTALITRDVKLWKLKWNVNLLSVFYCVWLGVSTAITYWLQVWVAEKKGPVFIAVFGPLTVVITCIFSTLLFRETLHWGSVCGTTLMIISVYGILWAKEKEGKFEPSFTEKHAVEDNTESASPAA